LGRSENEHVGDDAKRNTMSSNSSIHRRVTGAVSERCRAERAPSSATIAPDGRCRQAWVDAANRAVKVQNCDWAGPLLDAPRSHRPSGRGTYTEQGYARPAGRHRDPAALKIVRTPASQVGSTLEVRRGMVTRFDAPITWNTRLATALGATIACLGAFLSAALLMFLLGRPAR
jgi:hypothetical protein